MPAHITVHWLENSRGQRILWLLEELGLEYTVKEYKRNAKTLLAGADLRKVHPLGKSPVVEIQEDGHDTLTLAESGAIVEYLIERFGNGKFGYAPGSDALKRSQYLYWLHWAEGSAMLPLMLTIVCAQMPKQAPWIAKPIVSIVASQLMAIMVNPRLKENFGFVESHLGDKQFFVGDSLTGSDIMMSFPCEGLAASPLWNSHPNIKKWFEAMEARPAYKRALERGGANNLAAFTK
ncbi:hypothetical protein MVLG_02022 [Microbotryum lychnidis-dioicae p1A1 Lamole]|uniref:glutathione transferase n=1 Tax=Microbotryum lychnidis-dioicae (strain p1A1 Lamole / MvSl-1064) TaxID=683840 RepID=U5H3W7_USTV1|nr:hypothetical protein MVLG_02022 [Microbotryum lychnidis-dioicae p1A1 Lamole]|eukprot:KDE07750.1 hypothetical protein MVLG_02022 [Microbotryum lychnidis-dioicae p1A1 Lamole]